jgi:AcrR family transcriptional regulator
MTLCSKILYFCRTFVQDQDMARQKTIPDSEVFAVVLKLLLLQGEKSVTFATVAQKSRLAPPTLVQRFGSCPAMISAAVADAWQALEAQTVAVLAEAQASNKGVQAVLKALSSPQNSPALLTHSLQDPELTARAKAWRDQVEAGLALKLGSGAKSREAAAVTFAAWQGRLLWDSAGGKGFRLGEALKRLG